MSTVDLLQGAWEMPRRLKDWGEQCTPPLEDPCLAQISFERTPIEVMSIARFLLPAFTEHKNGVFLASNFSEEKFSHWSKTLHDISAIEKILNHVHIYDIFGYANDATEEELLQVAKLLQRTWDISLAKAFPTTQFDVSLQNSEQDYGPIISFTKIR